MIFKRLQRKSVPAASGPATDQAYLLLYEAARSMGAPGGLRDSLETGIAALQHRFKLTACLLFVEAGDGTLVLTCSTGISTEMAKTLTLRPGEGLAGVAYAAAQPRLVETVDSEAGDSLIKEMVLRHHVQSAFFVPLSAEGRVRGVAAYFSRRPKAFTTETVFMLERFTEHAALIERNARQWDEQRDARTHLESSVARILDELARTNDRLIQKVRELKTVYDLALATAASSTVEDVLHLIISGIQELVNVQSGAFFQLDATHMLKPVASAFGQDAAVSASLGGALELNVFLNRIVHEREAHILNFSESSDQLPAAWKSLNIRSLLALPLVHHQEVRGIFCVLNKLSGVFTPDDIRLSSLLTGRVTEVLQRLSLDQELRQRVQDLSVLQDIAAELPAVPVLTDTVAAIGRVVRKAIPHMDLCLFFVHQTTSEALVMMGGDWNEDLSFDSRALTVGVSEKVPVADAFRESHPQTFHREADNPGWESDLLVRAFGLEELMYLPLVIEQERIGVMAVGTRAPDGLAFEHRRLAGLIAPSAAIIVERARLYEKLRAANEKLEQINTLKNEFISMVSHELRTPLTTLKGFVSIVLNEETGPLNDQQRHFLQTSDRAIDRLTLLVSDLLDISRIEAGQIKMQLRPTSVKDVVGRMVNNFAPTLKKQNLSLSIEIPDGLPSVLGDPDRLGQVLDNLITNAIKFTSKGGLTISAADKGDFVMISVEDTGSGIPKSEHDRIFEKFYQIKTGGSWPAKGTGLGLAIVRSIVESHRGKVWVESEEGQGARFNFLLPRSRMELVEPAV